MSPEPLSTSDLARGARPEERDRPDLRAVEAGEPPRADEAAAPLFAPDAADHLRERWGAVQTGFVDEPRRAVEQADGLVAEAMKRLAETFATEREQLEAQWDRGDQVSTEDLRQVLRRYRSFFQRLLSV